MSSVRVELQPDFSSRRPHTTAGSGHRVADASSASRSNVSATKNKDIYRRVVSSESKRGHLTSSYRDMQTVHAYATTTWTKGGRSATSPNADSLTRIQVPRSMGPPSMTSSSVTTQQLPIEGWAELNGPGSPYSRAAASFNMLASKPSLSKELMHKLRSMTETLKMLSDENNRLRGENEKLKGEVEDGRGYIGVEEVEEAQRDMEEAESNNKSDIDKLSKAELISIVERYDEKVRTLSEEIGQLYKSREETAARGAGDRDKYKVLARRLKEERNEYREMCEQKAREHEELHKEMETMSTLVEDLRRDCSTLRDELLHLPVTAATGEHSDASVQVDLARPHASASRASSGTSIRRLSNGSNVSSESARRATAVYGGSRQTLPAQRALSASTSSSSQSISTRMSRSEKPNGHTDRSTVPSARAKSAVNKTSIVASRSSAGRSASVTSIPSPSRLPTRKGPSPSSSSKSTPTPTRLPTRPPSRPPTTSPEAVALSPPRSPVKPMAVEDVPVRDDFFDAPLTYQDEEPEELVLSVCEDGHIAMGPNEDREEDPQTWLTEKTTHAENELSDTEPHLVDQEANSATASPTTEHVESVDLVAEILSPASTSSPRQSPPVPSRRSSDLKLVSSPTKSSDATSTKDALEESISRLQNSVLSHSARLKTLVVLRPAGEVRSAPSPVITADKNPSTLEGIRSALTAHNYRTRLTRSIKTKADEGQVRQPTGASN